MLLLKNITMVRIKEDGSYDLRGASEEEAGAAIDHYFAHTPPEKNVFLMNNGLISRSRERLSTLIDHIKLFFYR